jgi:hypothetical protein
VLGTESLDKFSVALGSRETSVFGIRDTVTSELFGGISCSAILAHGLVSVSLDALQPVPLILSSLAHGEGCDC